MHVFQDVDCFTLQFFWQHLGCWRSKDVDDEGADDGDEGTDEDDGDVDGGEIEDDGDDVDEKSTSGDCSTPPGVAGSA